MKNLIILAVVLWLAPSISLAAWWNPLTWFKEKEVEVSVPADTGLGQIVVPIVEPIDEIAPSPESVTIPVPEPKVVEKIVTKTVADPVQIQKIKELIAQLDEANRTINDLKTQINSLRAQIATLTHATTNNFTQPPSTPSSPNTSEKIDYSFYPNIGNISIYIRNPLSYLGKPISAKFGLVVGFTPAIDPASSSYIHVVDYKAAPLDREEVALGVSSLDDYTQIVSQLKNGDLVIIYGLGAKSEEFKIIGSASGSYGKYKPVIILQQLLKCSEKNLCDDTPYALFSK